MDTSQFEAVLERGSDLQKPFVLWLLGRKEEARITANSVAAKFEDPTVLISYYDLDSDYAAIINVVETSWANLDDYELDFPGFDFGNFELAMIARAYKMAGDEDNFTDAVSRLRASLAIQRDQGSTHGTLLNSEAYLAMLVGDEELALKKIEEFATYGIGLSEFSRGNPIFKPLEADRRYQAAVAQIEAYSTLEREKLGLPPRDQGL